MDASLYPQMADLENKHWWFLARRKIIEHFLKKLPLSPKAKIFEAGCGTGGNLSMLARYGQVSAMEYDATARQFAIQQSHIAVQAGALPHDTPFAGEQFDLIVLFDVLEHLQEDEQALVALSARLKPNGWLFITVPALPMLWSKHDEMHHHYRRYVRTNLRKIVEKTGYRVKVVNYFNFFLSPLVFIKRFLNRFSQQESDDLALPPTWLNRLLQTIFASERFLLNTIPFPFGVSLLLLAQKQP